MIESGVEEAKALGGKWSVLKGNAICISHNRFLPEPYFYEKSATRICILGHPVYKEKIEYEAIATKLADRYRDHDFLASVNSEFLFFVADQDKESFHVISSRFSSPPFFYYEHAGCFIGACFFADIWLRLHKLGLLEITPDTFYHLIAYKRIFGHLTHDKHTFLMPPASVLTYDGSTVSCKRYWKPNFIYKTDKGLKQCIVEYSKRIKQSILRKNSDSKRHSLWLSGGMDTRTLLAAFASVDMLPVCITVNPFENREVQVARKVAHTVGAKHVFLPFTTDHYRNNFFESLKLVGTMQLASGMFLGFQDIVKEYADVAFHGHGFDYFFQGMYLPAKRYVFFGQHSYYKRLLTPDGPLTDWFLKNVPYRIIFKDQNMLRIILPRHRQRLHESVLHEVQKTAEEAVEITESPHDFLEYLTFYNLARHYPFADHWGINTNIPQRTISFDNDVYDFYQILPAKYRFDARLPRECVKLLNPELARIISANTTFPLGLSSLGRTLYQMKGPIKKRIRGTTHAIENNEFERMGSPLSYIICSQLRSYAEELLRSERLSSLNFIDMDEMRRYITRFLHQPTGNGQLPMALINIDQFLKQLEI